MTVLPADFSRRSAAILAHPRYPEARRAFIDGYLDLFSHRPALNKLLVEGSRHAIIMFAICLAAEQRDDDPDTWLTLGRLQDIVVAHQVGSPGLVEALVSRMLDMGLLETRPAPGDRRKRLLAPTPALLEHDLDIMTAQATALVLLEPSAANRHAAARDPAFQRAYRVASVAAFGEAMAMMADHPEMVQHFLNRDSGYLVLLCLDASAASADSSRGRISTVPYQEIADRFGVSRAHVHNIVADAEAAGLLRVVTPGRAAVELLERLDAAHDRLIADCLTILERRFAEAEAMGQHLPSPPYGTEEMGTATTGRGPVPAAGGC